MLCRGNHLSLRVGRCKQGMDIFLEAHNSSKVRIDRYTFASALSVCSRVCDLQIGMTVHGLAVVSGFSGTGFLTNSLIDMYSKCGNVDKARLVFDTSIEVDDVSWNSLISAFVRAGDSKEAFKVFVRMHTIGLKLNSFAIGSVLKCCPSLNDSEIIIQMMHGCVAKAGLDLDVHVGCAMLDVYAKIGLLNQAARLFRLQKNPNVVVFNAMIAGFSRSDVEMDAALVMEALYIFLEMERRGLQPSKFTFSSVLKACNLAEAFNFGRQIHGMIIKNDLQNDEFIVSALIDLYSGAGSIEDGWRCFHSSPRQDIVTWTSMISGHVQNEQFERALKLFHELLTVGRKPDLFTISSVMSACANLAIERTGQQIQSYMNKVGLARFTACGNSQIFMYTRSGDVDSAKQTFMEMEAYDVLSWSAMIFCHGLHGCAKDALLLFKEMERHQVTPNQVTFLGVLTACSHGGLVDEGFRYLNSMKRDYDVNPNAKHYACMVDLLGRAGRLADAEGFIIDSAFDKDPIIWRALLGSCRIHRDIDRGERVARYVMELDPGAASSYVLLYNIFLEDGCDSLAARMRDLMTERGVKKEPGLSWIEIGASIHSFVAGDKSHPQSEMIYFKLRELLLKIEPAGPDKCEPEATLMNCHSEKLAVALGIICLPKSAPIRVMRNLRICRDCHMTMKLLSEIEGREIVIRDPNRFHQFRRGSCSCGDYW